MNTKVLEYILAIAEHQSISRAAERFFLSQADLSFHLKNVERELGTPLFDRTAGGMRLTQAGIIFVNDAQVILHMESDLNAALATIRHQQKNRIRVMVDMPFYNRFIRLVIPRFQALYPRHSLEAVSCNASQARRALLDGAADFGVFFSSMPRWSHLEYLVFDTSESFCAFPPEFDGPTDASGLRAAVEGGMFMILYPVGTTMRAIEEQELAAHDIYPVHILEGDARNSISHISQNGVCGILADVFCTPEIRALIRVGDLFYSSYSVIAYSPAAPLSDAAQELMQIIIEEFVA